MLLRMCERLKHIKTQLESDFMCLDILISLVWWHLQAAVGGAAMALACVNPTIVLNLISLNPGTSCATLKVARTYNACIP